MVLINALQIPSYSTFCVTVCATSNAFVLQHLPQNELLCYTLLDRHELYSLTLEHGLNATCRVSYYTWNRHTCVPAIVAAIHRPKQTILHLLVSTGALKSKCSDSLTDVQIITCMKKMLW